MREKPDRSRKNPPSKPTWREKWGIGSSREKRLEERRAERKRQASEIRDRVLQQRAQQERERRERARQDQTPTERLEFIGDPSLIEDAEELRRFDGGEAAAGSNAATSAGDAETVRGETVHQGTARSASEEHLRALQASEETVARLADAEDAEGAEDAQRNAYRASTGRESSRLRPPKHLPRIIFSAAEAAAASWALVLAVALVAFLLTAGNPWMLETDWNAPLAIGADAWAMSFGAPITLAAVPVRMIPLGLTALNVVFARIALDRCRAESWQASLLFVPAYVVFVEILSLLFGFHAHRGWLALGAFMVALLAWIWSAKSWDWHVALVDEVKPYLRGVVDGLRATALLAIAGLVTLIVAIVAGWQRIMDIQELLNASIADLIFAWLAQLMFLPNAVAWAASWLTGPGFYTGSDAIITPSRADVTAIPAIPVMGAFPHTEIGIWVVAIPIVLGVLFGAYLIWKRRETDLKNHLIHAGLIALTMFVVTTIWMWLATGSLGIARMSLLGPRWIYSTIFATLEIGVVAAVIYALAHPTLLAQYVAGGKRAKASTIATVGTVSEKIHSHKSKSHIDEDAADETENYWAMLEDGEPVGEGSVDGEPAREDSGQGATNAEESVDADANLEVAEREVDTPDTADSSEDPAGAASSDVAETPESDTEDGEPAGEDSGQGATGQEAEPAPEHEPEEQDEDEAADASGDLENQSGDPSAGTQVDGAEAEDKTGDAHA